MHIIITIDFGMTGSAAEWFNFAINDEPQAKGGQIGKIPTKLAYGENNEVLAFGAACENYEGARELFKAKFAARTLAAENLVSDYLQHFCNHVLQDIIRVEKTARENINAEWHFTTPGLWGHEIQRDFRMLASKVLLELMPGCKIVVELTEAFTSCKFLLNEIGFPDGAWVITCDIGGATVDTALAIARDEEVFPIFIQKPPNELFGVCRIDEDFDKNAQLYLEGNHPAESFQLVSTQGDLSKTTEWRSARHSFDASKEVVLAFGNDLGKSLSPENQISIHGYTMRFAENFIAICFQDFVLNLYSEIDGALRKVERLIEGKMAPPGIIALCGGGGTMVYVIDQLKLRYPRHEIRAPSCPDRSCLATLIGHRLYLKQRADESYIQNVEIGISSPDPSDEILWQKLQIPSNAASWVFKSTRKVEVHYLAVRKHNNNAKLLPPSPEDLKRRWRQFPELSVRILHVKLNSRWWNGQKYCIEVKCDGIEKFDVRAYDLKNKDCNLELTSAVLGE